MTPMHRLRLLPVLAFASSLSCARPPVPAAPQATQESLDTGQGHLLVFPIGDAESLLGRPVHTTSDGAWTIADGRLPGCEVRATRKAATFKSKRRVALRTMASITAGFARMLGFEARHGTDVLSEVEVDNTAILEADTRGQCGEQIIGAVFVGRGHRKLLRGAEAAVGGGGTFQSVGAKGTYDSSMQLDDSIEWAEEQAYAFTVQSNPPASGPALPDLELSVQLEPSFKAGQEVSASISTNRPSYLIVYYLGSDGSGEVLWPSSEEPEPHSEPGAPTRFPSAREVQAKKRIYAKLDNPTVAARETLVVYAFSELDDFRKLRPSTGGNAADGAAYATLLTEKLQSIPRSRWSRFVAGYTIVPER